MDNLISFIEGDVTGIAFLLFIFIITPFVLGIIYIFSLVVKKTVEYKKKKKNKALRNAYKAVIKDLRRKKNTMDNAIFAALAIAYEEYNDAQKKKEDAS